MTGDEPKVAPGDAQSQRPDIDFDRLFARAAEYQQVINDRAATWEIDFEGGSGDVVSVSDAAHVLARHTLETEAAPPPPGVSADGRGLGMVLRFDDIDPVATCACGNRSHGDSIMDALAAWAKHVTGTPACRDKL